MKKLTGAILVVGTPSEISNLRYASGFAAVDAAVFLQSRRGGVLAVPLLEKGRAGREAKRGVRVVASTELPLRKNERGRISGWTLALLRAERKRSVRVSPSFPAGIVDRLRHEGIRVQIADTPLFPQREVKTPRELASIQQAQRAAGKAMRAAIAQIAGSEIHASGELMTGGKRLTSEEVRRTIDMELLAHDCVGSGTIVAHGPQGADPHERGSGGLRAGEPIVIDIFPQHRGHGYWGDLTRTVVRGRAPRDVAAMYAAVRQAHRAALAQLRAGRRTGAVHAAVNAVLERRGFETKTSGGVPEGFIHSTGHGVGLDIHEAPSVGPGDAKLRAGAVITIEPGLYYRRIGGIRLEDTVVITRTGYRQLASVPMRLELL